MDAGRRRCSDLFVVVSYFNEERWLPATLAALAMQLDTAFCLVLVDNASTDRSLSNAMSFAAAHPSLCVHHVTESQKGTGAAADTGFRYAIGHGARWIARTDADCLPNRNWVATLRRALDVDGLEFVAGRIHPRNDEGASPWPARCVLYSMIWIAETYVRLARRGPQYRYPCFLVSGNNLAISASLYVRIGGFTRSCLEDIHEDRALAERVRTTTSRAALRQEIIVYHSARRVRAYGYLNTLRWYRNHGYRPAMVDVR